MQRSQQLSFLVAAVCLAASASGQQRAIEVGKALPVTSATAATGPWLERAPLNPATYGQTRGVSPATSPEAKIVLYTPTLSEDFFKLARRVDSLIEKHPELKWSFVQVSDPKGAQRGGYTADELKTRLAELKTLAESHELKHLSLVVAAPAARPGSSTITLAFTKQSTAKYQHPVVAWTGQTDEAKLDRATIEKLIGELSATIGE
ncbi:hypothetical protein [Armatimonas rosea]|uniref:Uncharacterized protein n=1 Tax=Armatimonas rosea TaxID=685828 RepID=A0A7W9W8Z5_ARMRO|nr:hypothetical protein [Armatimonas rosea]MBB6052771.1 hypothetical protein [Armatimonas rosea]